ACWRRSGRQTARCRRGESYARMGRKLSAEDRDQLAGDAGILVGAIARMEPLRLACDGRAWRDFAAVQVGNAEAVHLGRGCPPEWATRLAAFQCLRDIELACTPCWQQRRQHRDYAKDKGSAAEAAWIERDVEHDRQRGETA